MLKTLIKGNTNKVLKTLIMGVISTTLLLGSQLAIAAQGHLKVTSKAQKMVVVNRGGKVSYQFKPATLVLPGETIQYNTSYQNISNKPADNINIVNPIPKHTVYLANSARGQNTNIQFSVDGGRTYGQVGTLRIRGRDGKTYVAKPSDYTHIRWQYHGSLAPKARQAVTFRVRLL
jgi:uncharacterized repeat protein (TIGR01451 family)